MFSHCEITTVGTFGLSYQFCLLAAKIAAPKCLKLDDQVRLVLESIHEILWLMGFSQGDLILVGSRVIAVSIRIFVRRIVLLNAPH